MALTSCDIIARAVEDTLHVSTRRRGGVGVEGGCIDDGDDDSSPFLKTSIPTATRRIYLMAAIDSRTCCHT